MIAPDVFTIDVANKCVVLDPEADTAEKVREAAEACPCMAAFSYHSQALPSSLGTPMPLAYLTPRTHCASASPASASFLICCISFIELLCAE